MVILCTEFLKAVVSSYVYFTRNGSKDFFNSFVDSLALFPGRNVPGRMHVTLTKEKDNALTPLGKCERSNWVAGNKPYYAREE